MTKISIFQELKNKAITNKWVEGKSKGFGDAGITLEAILGKERENFELPDYQGIEIKTKYSTKESYITLFTAVPDSYLFEIKRIVSEYGYPDNNYPEFKVFNLSLYGNRKKKLNNNYFSIYVDRKNEKVVLRVYDLKHNIIDELTTWSFEMLKEKLERKLKYLAIIYAVRRLEHNISYYKYTKINCYELKDFEQFLLLLENGMIRITFRIGIYKSGKRFGQIYDHGTSFSIDECDINRLFDKIKID